MADQTIGVNNQNGAPTPAEIDVTEVTTSKGTAERQRMQVGGANGAELADVRNSMPIATDYGLVVREVATPYLQLLASDGVTVKVLKSASCVLYEVQNMTNNDQTNYISMYDTNTATLTGLTPFYIALLAAGAIIPFGGSRGMRLANGLVVVASAALSVGANFLVV